MKSFAQAIDYVNLNQDEWNRMIESCYKEWVSETNHIDSKDWFEEFDQYVSSKYGIRIIPLKYNTFNYQVVDQKKYMLFQIAFA